MEQDKKIKRISFLISLASILQIAETLIPHPFPGIRLGLANVITLIALVNLGFRDALMISVLRTIISSFILGTFMSPSFILSFSGALVSTLLMGLFYRLSTLNSTLYTLHSQPFFSIIGISLIGAFSHNLTQIFLVYLILIKHKAVFLILPFLGISAVVTGWISGVIALKVCKNLENTKGPPLSTLYSTSSTLNSTLSTLHSSYIPTDSFIHSLSPVFKILFLVFLSIIVIFTKNFSSVTLIFFFLFFVILLSKIPVFSLFSGIKRAFPFIVFSFVTPVLFNRTREGLNLGLIFSIRIILLLLSASFLLRTTSPESLTKAFRVLFGKNIGRIIILSLNFIPVLREKIYSFIKEKKANGKKIIPSLTELIAKIYQQGDSE